MTDETEHGPPQDPSASRQEPQPPNHEEYVRRMKEAEARGEDPMPIAHEEIMAVLDWIKAKHADRKPE